jgi:two-component system OmpR family sensor kinase
VSARTPPIDALALSLAQLRPVHIDRGGRRADLFPDGAMLGRWLAIDGAALGLGLLAIAGSAGFVSASRARADRAGLQAALEKRDAEAARYRRFLAETGHELRTPLTVMSGYVDIMRSSASGGALDARIVEGMYAETARMRVLVEKMLTLARLDSEAAVPRLIDLAAATEEAAETARRRFPSAHISLRASADARVVIDADDYAAALGNLIENAVKYAPSSPIAIETGIANGMTFTRVTDRGPGIPAGQRDAIFERFFRGDERSGSQGSGLGLAIVKRVTERWNGSVELRSDGGETAFTLLFPQADEELHAAVR